MDLKKLFSNDRAEVLSSYGVTEKDVNMLIDDLKNWLEGEQLSPAPLLKDDLLERFLMKNKFSIEKTKTKIENYCTLRSKHMIFYENYEEIIPSKEIAIILPMFELNDDLERIVVCKIVNEQKFDFVRSVRSMMLILELGTRLDYSCGEVFLMDLAENGASLITKINLLLFRDALNLVLKAYPARLKAVHLINGSKVINVLMSLLKPILPKKIYERIHIHNSTESLHEIIPPKCLPQDYGGHKKCLKEMLGDYDMIFRESRSLFEEAFKITSKGKLKPADFPPEGTFRKLQID